MFLEKQEGKELQEVFVNHGGTIKRNQENGNYSASAQEKGE